MPFVSVELLGQKFGRLTVVAKIGRKGKGRSTHWSCQCDCGGSAITTTAHLNGRHTTSCGCFRDTVAIKHGRSSARNGTYGSWRAMKSRCSNPNDVSFPNYGCRGITVCDRWENDFCAFLEDLGERPVGTTIERIDNEGNYEPGNCRWATRREQMRNSRIARLVEVDGVIRTIAEWVRLAGIDRNMLNSRLRRGWHFKDALLAISGRTGSRLESGNAAQA